MYHAIPHHNTKFLEYNLNIFNLIDLLLYALSDYLHILYDKRVNLVIHLN